MPTRNRRGDAALQSIGVLLVTPAISPDRYAGLVPRALSGEFGGAHELGRGKGSRDVT
jgi:hypothetical protein